MNRNEIALAALVAATSWTGCTPARTDGPERLAAALAGAERAQGCAVELWKAANLDPEETARLLRLEPAALAPWGGATRGAGAVRTAILERARSARANAFVARGLASLADVASSDQVALSRQKIEESLTASRALCDAADELRTGPLAQRR